MRLVKGLLAAALVLMTSGAALAQGTQPPPVPTPPLAPADDTGFAHSHWYVSGAVGSTFGTADTAVNFNVGTGATSLNIAVGTGYLWRGVFGGEFLTSFNPGFGSSGIDSDNDLSLYGYMANLIGAIPLGGKGQYQPYVSGGWGGMASSLTRSFDFVDRFGNTQTISRETKTGSGTNVGAGLMAYFGDTNFGLRADARWFHSTTSGGNLIGERFLDDPVNFKLLDGLSFWQTNVGLTWQF